MQLSSPPQPSTLVELPLFVGLSPTELETLCGLFDECEVGPGTVLMEGGGHCGKVFIVIEGLVKITLEHPHIKRCFHIAILGPGEVLGDLNALNGQGHTATVETLETTRLLFLESAAFVHLLETAPRLAVNYARGQAQRLGRITAQLQSIGTVDVPGRLARQLLYLAHLRGQPLPTGGVKISINLTQDDLAASICAGREQVQKLLQKWHGQGYVGQFKSGLFVLLNVAALTKLSR